MTHRALCSSFSGEGVGIDPDRPMPTPLRHQTPPHARTHFHLRFEGAYRERRGCQEASFKVASRITKQGDISWHNFSPQKTWTDETAGLIKCSTQASFQVDSPLSFLRVKRRYFCHLWKCDFEGLVQQRDSSALVETC